MGFMWMRVDAWVSGVHESTCLTHAFTEMREVREGFLVAGATHRIKLGRVHPSRDRGLFAGAFVMLRGSPHPASGTTARRPSPGGRGERRRVRVPGGHESACLTHAFTEMREVREGFLGAGATHRIKLGRVTRDSGLLGVAGTCTKLFGRRAGSAAPLRSRFLTRHLYKL